MLYKGPIFEQLPERPLAHCATLTALPDGTLLAAWFGGAYETSTDMVILASRRVSPGDSGTTHSLRGSVLHQTHAWSPPQVIARVPGHGLGQPVFLVRPEGELWLFFVVIASHQPPPTDVRYNMMPPVAAWTSARPHWQRSLDGGRTWERAEPLLDHPGLMFRSHPLLLPGRIIVPMYDENTWQSRMLISDDDGRSWRLTEPIVSPAGNIHPCLVELSDGWLLAYLRTGGAGGFIWRTESSDGGDTWSPPTPTTLPNPNSGIDLLRLHSGHLLLAFNNSQTRRTPLCVALAGEDERWDWVQTLEDGPGEFSYPAMIQTDDGRIHMVYTYQRQHIHYATFTEDWVRAGIRRS